MDTATLGKIMEAQRDLYLRKGDNVLVVVTKSFRNAPVADVLSRWSYHIIEIDDAKRPGEEYPLPETLMEGKTVGWIISNVSLSHSIGSEMIKRGMFVISNPGMTEDWLDLLRPANAQACRRNADALEKAIGGDKGGTIHIFSADGTDLRLQVPDGNWDKEVGERTGVGTNGLFGEYCTAPYNANGTYVLQPGDFLTNPINRVEETITLSIRDNVVVEITGGKQTQALRKMLEDANNPLAFNLGEVAIGVNPAQPQQVQRSVVAEKLLGGVHIAMGNNSVCLKATCPDLGRFHHGRYNAGVHIDAIKFGAIVTFTPEDNINKEVLLVKDGKLAV